MSESILAQSQLDDNLRTALAVATNRPIGLSVAPKPTAPATSPAMPYAIVYPIPGGGFSGPGFHHPDADADVVYQVTSIGETSWQATRMGDMVRKFFLGRTATGAFTSPITAPDGFKVYDRRSDSGPGGVDMGDKALFSKAERFVLSVTPT